MFCRLLFPAQGSWDPRWLHTAGNVVAGRVGPGHLPPAKPQRHTAWSLAMGALASCRLRMAVWQPAASWSLAPGACSGVAVASRCVRAMRWWTGGALTRTARVVRAPACSHPLGLVAKVFGHQAPRPLRTPGAHFPRVSPAQLGEARQRAAGTASFASSRAASSQGAGTAPGTAWRLWGLQDPGLRCSALQCSTKRAAEPAAAFSARFPSLAVLGSRPRMPCH